MSHQAKAHTKIPRRAAQMGPEELSPHTVNRGTVLEKPRRGDSQLPDASLARASALLRSPHAQSPLVTPSSNSSTRAQKVNQQIMLQHFAALDIEMVYQPSDDDDDEVDDQGMGQHVEMRRGSYPKERADSMDMALAFYSDH